MANERTGRYLGERHLMSLFGENDSKTEHGWVEERLSAYLDGELSSKERNAVERHLARCQDCQWELRTLRQTIQWTKELPTVQVPRVFTIQAPAQAARARRRERRWGLALLQGATALVALLLVFSVAGDFVLTGLRPASAPQPQIVKEQGVVESGTTEANEVVVTQEVAMQSAPPAAAEAEKAAAEASPVAEPTQAASAEPTMEGTVAEASAAPAPTEAEPAGPTVEEPLRAMAPTASPQVSGMGAPGFEAQPTETTKAAGEGVTTEAPRAAVATTEEPPTAAATEAPQAYAAQDTTASAPSPEPTLPPEPASEQEPTIVAAAPRIAGARQPLEQEQAASQEPLVTWLRSAEVVLGIAFLMLATATLVLTIRRRRAR
jgi:anti-sigma factor RsiW